MAPRKKKIAPGMEVMDEGPPSSKPKTRARKKVGDRPSQFNSDLYRIAQINREANVLAAEKKMLQEQILDQMQGSGTKTLTVEHEEVRILATVVAPTSVVVNEDKLKKAIGAEAFTKITKKVMDKALLEDAMSRGNIDINIVTQCSEEVASKPYLKVTEK